MSIDCVYVLPHIDAHEDEKLIGVYRTEKDSLAAMERAKEKHGFSEAGDRFVIDKYELNQDHWTEGFGRPVD
jgi:hypothetical protein